MIQLFMHSELFQWYAFKRCFNKSRIVQRYVTKHTINGFFEPNTISVFSEPTALAQPNVERRSVLQRWMFGENHVEFTLGLIL